MTLNLDSTALMGSKREPVTRVVLALALGATLALTGCGSARIYSETRDKQAAAAKDRYDKLELQKGIDTERANLDKLLAAELAMQDKLAQGVRDFELRTMLEGASTQVALLGPLDLRIKALAGSSAQMEKANKFSGDWDQVQLDLARARNNISLAGAPVPECVDFAKIPAGGQYPQKLQTWVDREDGSKQPARQKQAILVGQFADDVKKYCANPPVSPLSAVGGDTGAAWQRYQNDLSELNAKKNAVRELNDAYSEARAELDKAIAEGKSEPENLPKVQAAATKVKEALEKLKAANGNIDVDRINNPYLTRLLSQKRIESIEAFLSAVTEYQPGQPLPASSSKAVMMATLLPSLVDQTQQTLKQANKPLITPYVLERNYHQLNLEAANRDIAASEDIVRHSKEIADALFLQSQQLVVAQNELKAKVGKGGASVAATYASTPFVDALKNASPKEKQQLYSASGRYLDALNRLDAKRYKLEYTRVADFHSRSLAYAEVNTRQWESLIGTSVAQLQEYGAGGIKDSQIVALFNALMLAAIAWGVN